LYLRFGEAMKANDDHPRLADEHLLRHDRSDAEFQRDALQQARARQDKSYAALEIWIAAAIAELAAER
jgi:hypothetical protein